MNRPSILVVDDDTGHRRALEVLIARWGYAVSGASDGAEAVRAVEKADPPFAAVLMDIRMAGMDGLAALRILRQQAPELPVILMTAYASLETAIEALRDGATDYCLKPLDFDFLRARLARCLVPDETGAAAGSGSGAVAAGKAGLGNASPGNAGHGDTGPGNTGPGDTGSGNAGSSNAGSSNAGSGSAGAGSAGTVRCGLVGQSRVMRELTDLLERVAASEATVLVTGPSGTGKELVARAIHNHSLRASGPWVAVNCAALSENLLESELFGHEKGAFTGADRRRDGRFLQAAGGTLFLDEIGEMPLSMQAKLLRAIQQREIQRVGGDVTLAVDVRLVAATNRDLALEVREGRFREDLYYRLNVVALHVPALRERLDDIPLLARHFLAEHAARNRKNVRGLAPAVLERLMAYTWPGNVRELENVMERAVILAVGDVVTERELPLVLTSGARPATGAPSLHGTRLASEAAPGFPSPDSLSSGLGAGLLSGADSALSAGLPDSGEQAAALSSLPGASGPSGFAAPPVSTLEDLERDAILRTLAATGDNKTEAARRLGISRKTLHLKLRRYALEQTSADADDM